MKRWPSLVQLLIIIEEDLQVTNFADFFCTSKVMNQARPKSRVFRVVMTCS
jgi:hypothetical protein